MKVPSLFVFLIGGLLACTRLPPQTSELEIGLPESFSSSGEIALPSQWWEAFEDPVLDALVVRALSRNFSLLSAWDRLAQAEAVADRAGAARFPSLELRADAARSESRGPSGTLTTGQQTRSFKRFSMGLGAAYEVDLWGRIGSEREAAAYALKASEEDLQAAAISLSAQVATTWYRLVEQYGQLALLDRQLKVNTQVSDLVALRFRHGRVRAADVLRQRQLVESSRGEITQAQSRAGVLEHQLAVLLGYPPATRVSARPTQLTPLPLLPDTGLPAEWIQRRPDIRRAEYQLLAANEEVGVAVSKRFPRLSFSAQLNSSSESMRNLFDNWLSTLAANLVAPIVDGGSRRAEVRRTLAVLSQGLNDYRQIVLNAMAEVENALIQEENQRALIASLEKQLVLSTEVLARTRDSYLQGAEDYLRILDFLLTHQAIERNLLQSRREALEFRIALHRALGGAWEMNRPPQARAFGTAFNE